MASHNHSSLPTSRARSARPHMEAGIRPTVCEGQGSCSVAKSAVSAPTLWMAARQTSLPFTVIGCFLWTWKSRREDAAWAPALPGLCQWQGPALCAGGWGPCPWEAPADVLTCSAHSQVHPASTRTTEAGWGLAGGAERTVGSESAGAAEGCQCGEGLLGLGPAPQPENSSLGASFSSLGKPPPVWPLGTDGGGWFSRWTDPLTVFEGQG